jgi:hypothetical protein
MTPAPTKNHSLSAGSRPTPGRVVIAGRIAEENLVPSEPTSGREESRRAWMDNLRVAVIVGVIVTHVATTYVLDIDWYYEERTATRRPRPSSPQ